MIILENVKKLDGSQKNFSFPSDGADRVINGENLLALQAGIDPHVHFRTPGFEYKEDWRTGAHAALKGGYTTVLDMPNTNPATVTLEYLKAKKALIDKQLAKAGIPLRYQLYFGADKNHFDQLSLVPDQVIGLKIFMGASTGQLLMDDDASLDEAFKCAAALKLLVAVHAESEAMIQERTKEYADCKEFPCHSQIRTPAVAARAISQAIDLVRKYGTRLYILHVSSQAEINLIRAAKKEGLPVYAETCPHYLFLSTDDYARLQGRAQMNPALREPSEKEHVWQAIREGIIDTIGSDHAPHTLEEKNQPYGCCPSGVPGIETTLPLLYTAYRNQLLTMDDLVRLIRTNPQKIFDLPDNEDYVFIDMETEQPVRDEQLCTKVKWSPYVGMSLFGWPQYITLKNRFYDLGIMASMPNF